MSLTEFDVRGEQINSEETDEVIREGDPERGLVRYQPDGSVLFVHVRLNFALLELAVSRPILRLKPLPASDEVMASDALLTAQGSVRNYRFLERLCEDVAAACPACYLAEAHGEGRRDFFFVTEDAATFERLAVDAAAAFGLPLGIEEHSLADVAPIILPVEAIGDLGLEVAADARTRSIRFEFWGADPSLVRLRAELERRGYRFLSIDSSTRELRMLKETPIDGPGFQGVLKQIVPLSRSLGCSYRGTETVGGFEQFGLTRPLPERYAPDPKSRGGLLRGVFGRKGR